MNGEENVDLDCSKLPRWSANYPCMAIKSTNKRDNIYKENLLTIRCISANDILFIYPSMKAVRLHLLNTLFELPGHISIVKEKNKKGRKEKTTYRLL